MRVLLSTPDAKARGPGYAAALRDSATSAGGDAVDVDPKVFSDAVRAFPRAEQADGFPPLVVQAKNFLRFAGTTAARAVRDEPLLVPPDIKAARKAVCAVCSNLQDGRCLLCGCGMWKWAQKVAWAGEQCPDKPPRWGTWEGAVNGPLNGG